MNADLHERARLLIALSGPEVPDGERLWLAAHLESCAACREFARRTDETIRSLRAIPVMAGASLVSATRVRVRQRAQELRARQERLHVIWVCSVAVSLCTAFNTIALWRGFGWLTQWLEPRWVAQWIGPLPAPLVGLGFVALSSMPAIMAGVILLAHGTHMADSNGSLRG